MPLIKRTTTLLINGPITIMEAPHFERALSDTRFSSEDLLVINLSGVSLITTPGFAAMLSTWERAKEAGAKMALLQPTPTVRETLQRLRLIDILTVIDSLDELKL